MQCVSLRCAMSAGRATVWRECLRLGISVVKISSIRLRFVSQNQLCGHSSRAASSLWAVKSNYPFIELKKYISDLRWLQKRKRGRISCVVFGIHVYQDGWPTRTGFANAASLSLYAHILHTETEPSDCPHAPLLPAWSLIGQPPSWIPSRVQLLSCQATFSVVDSHANHCWLLCFLFMNAGKTFTNTDLSI